MIMFILIKDFDKRITIFMNIPNIDHGGIFIYLGVMYITRYKIVSKNKSFLTLSNEWKSLFWH